MKRGCGRQKKPITCPEGGAARWLLKVTAHSHREERKTLRGTQAVAFLTQKAAWIVDTATSWPPRLPAVSSRQRTSSFQPVLLLLGLAEPDGQGRILQGPSPRRAALGALQRQSSQVTSDHLGEESRVWTTLPPEGRVSISVPRCLNIKVLWHY